MGKMYLIQNIMREGKCPFINIILLLRSYEASQASFLRQIVI
jgi:hypothetical protein